MIPHSTVSLLVTISVESIKFRFYISSERLKIKTNPQAPKNQTKPKSPKQPTKQKTHQNPPQKIKLRNTYFLSVDSIPNNNKKALHLSLAKHYNKVLKKNYYFLVIYDVLLYKQPEATTEVRQGEHCQLRKTNW